MLLDLLFKHITDVSVLLKGEIRCVKNVSIISQFKIKCNSIWVYLLYLFIHAIFNEDNSPSHLYPRPSHTGIAVEKPGYKVLDNYFLIVPAAPGKCGVITLGHLPCWDFLLCRVGQREGAYTRALESENHYPRPSP